MSPLPTHKPSPLPAAGSDRRHRARRSRSHAVRLIRIAPGLAPDDILVVDLSGRGDKDMGIMARDWTCATSKSPEAKEEPKANAD